MRIPVWIYVYGYVCVYMHVLWVFGFSGGGGCMWLLSPVERPLTHPHTHTHIHNKCPGCGDACPWMPAKHHIDWTIEDPKHMEPEQFNKVGLVFLAFCGVGWGGGGVCFLPIHSTQHQTSLKKGARLHQGPDPGPPRHAREGAGGGGLGVMLRQWSSIDRGSKVLLGASA